MSRFEMDTSKDGPAATAGVDDAVLMGDGSPISQRLLAAAIDAIDADGESALRVQDVAAAAGVQLPVLYRKFGSRDGLVQDAQVRRLKAALDRELTELSAAVAGVANVEEFRALIDALLVALNEPYRRTARWKRINVIGSSYARPAMAAVVSSLQREAIVGIASLFKRAQQEGWLRPALDLEAFAAWFAGQALGRILIETGDVGVDEAAWNAISADAVRHVLFASNATDLVVDVDGFSPT
jgi:AcrR family transcriptional regulator